MLLEIFVVIFIIILGLFVKHFITRRKDPPGPLGIPFFGGRLFRIIQFLFPKLFPPISDKEYFQEMKKRYGKIWSVDDGDKRIFVLASIDLINEAFVDNGKVFSGKPAMETLKIISEEKGIMFAEGELWQANRQLAIKALRDLGMGKQLLESQICEEADELIENLERNSSRSITSPKIFLKATSNIIGKLAFSIRNKYDDKDFEAFIEDLKIIGHSDEPLNIIELFSHIIPMKLMRKIFPPVNEFIESMSGCMKFIDNKCKARIKVESEFSKPACVLDFFWRYRYQDHPEVKYDEKFHDISHSMFDLYIGGTDTINNVMGFCCLFLGKEQDLQNDLRKEIQSLVDDYKLINMEMRKNCPKLLSFIDEITRFSPLDSLIFRRAISDCVFKGYKIRTTDVVYGDLLAITKDPEHFENPTVFNPYRFLDKSRTKYIPNKSLIPFGLGKRACLGESMGKMELFLFLSKILLKFNLSLPLETKSRFDEILEGTSGFIHTPLDHKINFQPIDSKQ